MFRFGTTYGTDRENCVDMTLSPPMCNTGCRLGPPDAHKARNGGPGRTHNKVIPYQINSQNTLTRLILIKLGDHKQFVGKCFVKNFIFLQKKHFPKSANTSHVGMHFHQKIIPQKPMKQATMHTGRPAQTTHTSQADAFIVYLPPYSFPTTPTTNRTTPPYTTHTTILNRHHPQS